MSETRTSQMIRMAISAIGGRVFRNQRGLHLTLDGKRRVTTGLAPGASDLIGWVPITILPEHVGMTMAIFTALEVKTGKREATEEQETFMRIVSEDGGIAGVVRSEEDAERLVKLRVSVPFRVRF